MYLLTILLQATGNAGGGSPKSSWMNIIFILLLVVLFWLFFIRPQTKRAKEQAKFRNELKKGDKVLTIGGFHGRIVEVKEATVMLSIAPDIIVEIEKNAIAQSPSQVGQS